MVRMLRLTDAFIWEDLPTTDPVTGSLTMAAWIPRIQRFTSSVIISAISFHVAQSTARVLTSDDPSFVFGTGYPFDQKKSPAFEIINLAQVKCPSGSGILLYASCYVVRMKSYIPKCGKMCKYDGLVMTLVCSSFMLPALIS
jgi:hypothetical protein